MKKSPRPKPDAGYPGFTLRRTSPLVWAVYCEACSDLLEWDIDGLGAFFEELDTIEHECKGEEPR